MSTVELARHALNASVQDIKADYGPEFAESVDDGEIVADLLVSMAAMHEFPPAVLRELCIQELGFIPMAAQEYL